MMVRFHLIFSIFIFNLLMIVSCGSASDERSNQANGSLDSGRSAAEQVVYCDDMQQLQDQRSGIPYEYPGQECMKSPDGEPLVDVRPGGQAGAHPGQAPGYNSPCYKNPGNNPCDQYRNNPCYQNPSVPCDPNQNDPQWQTPPTYPQNPSQPDWQTPPNYPNAPNNPDYSTPGYDGEPLPY